MTRIWVIGGTTFDVLTSGLARLPEVDPAGDEFTDTSLVHLEEAPVQSVGGNGGNLAVTLARLGAKTHLCTSLGDDALGRSLVAWLEEAGCELSLLPPRQTSFNFVATDVEGRRRSFFFPVALDTGSALKLLDRTRFDTGDHLALAGYPHPSPIVLASWAERARAAGATVSLDICPVTARFSLSSLVPLLPHLDILFCNQRELAALDTEQDPRRLTDYLSRDSGVGLVLKRGPAGAAFFGGDERIEVPAHPSNARITVGAGDSFDAGFIYSKYRQGVAAEVSLRFASALVAHVLEKGRGVSGAPTAAEVRLFQETHNGQ